MAGMDASNARLRGLAEQADTSIGEVYGGIDALSSGHTDQFVEMLPALGTGDATSLRLTAFVWYRVLPDEGGSFEHVLDSEIVPWERAQGVPSATGRFLVSDGWDYLRLLGFESLADYQRYWTEITAGLGHDRIDVLTTARREIIVANVPELAVR
jgi:hypothetical protein